MVTSDLKIEDRWLLAIIGLLPYVEGRTRLHKFGLLSFREVLRNEDFFDDWKPDKYGGFSPKLASSLIRLEKLDCVQSTEIITENEYPVNRYFPTEKGKNLNTDFIREHIQELNGIKSIILHYYRQPLLTLLQDVYQRYPDLAVNSTIKADVNRIEYLRYPDPEYDTTPPKIPAGRVSTVPAQQHVLGDYYFREKLSKSIGLENVPDLDPKSFDRIQGILSEEIGTEHFDSEELVREVRGC